jgi:c-di-GMP-binding flagellar brake protein YcgR
MPDPTALPLQIAQTVQLQSLKFGQIRLYSKLVGYVDKHSIIVTSPALHGGLQSIIDGDAFICRAFGGKYAYAFRTHVLRVVSVPFPHLFLAYPKAVEKAVIRKATRVGVALRGVLKKGSGEGELQAEAAITDISLTGAGSTSRNALAEVGEQVTVQILADDSQQATPFECSAVIKSVRPAEASSEQAQYGLEFTSLTESQSRALMEIIQNHLLIGA